MNTTGAWLRIARFMGCVGLAATVACGGASGGPSTQPSATVTPPSTAATPPPGAARVVGRMRLYGGAEIEAAGLPAVTGQEDADALSAPDVVSTHGEFDPRIVAVRVRGQAEQIKGCYERELARNPRLRGALRVEFVILPDGTVTGVTVTENTISPGVGSCVMEVIASLYFSPGPTGGFVRYRFPFVFEPGG